MTNSITAESIARGLDKARRRGAGWTACCPAHDDSNPSLSITDAVGGRVLVRCHAGCSQDAVIDALRARGLWPEAGADTEECRYPYRREDGAAHFAVHMRRDRLTGKKHGRPWRVPTGIKPPHPLFRVLAVLADPDRPVVVVEGEQTALDVEDAWPDGAIPVTWAGGAGAWRTADWSPLYGRTVTICADADKPGRDAAQGIARRLHDNGARVSLVLPDGDDGADLSDWLREGRKVARECVESLKRDYEAPEAPAAADSGLAFMTIAELLDRPEEAQPWLVDGLLPEGGFGVFSGKPKSGKSTAARHLAHCVAAGERWLDRATATGPVLYLALEEKVSEVRRHFMALATPRDAPLHVTFHRGPGESADLLATAAETMRPRLIVVDTLFRFAPVQDTDAYGAVLDTLAPLQDIARASGAHVLAVHHDRKAEGEGGDRVLGSTAIFGTVDVLLSIERRYGDNVRVLSSIGRYGEDLPETVVELRPDGGVRLEGAVGEAEARRARDGVLSFITDNPGATNDEIRAGCGLRWQVAQPALRDLVRDRKIERSGAGRQGDPYRHHAEIACSRGEPVPEHCPPVPAPYKAGTGGQAPVQPVREQAGNRRTGNVVELPKQPADTERAGEAYRRLKDGD